MGIYPVRYFCTFNTESVVYLSPSLSYPQAHGALHCTRCSVDPFVCRTPRPQRCLRCRAHRLSCVMLQWLPHTTPGLSRCVLTVSIRGNSEAASHWGRRRPSALPAGNGEGKTPPIIDGRVGALRSESWTLGSVPDLLPIGGTGNFY